jgi:hypothetical protein
VRRLQFGNIRQDFFGGEAYALIATLGTLIGEFFLGSVVAVAYALHHMTTNGIEVCDDGARVCRIAEAAGDQIVRAVLFESVLRNELPQAWIGEAVLADAEAGL